MLDKEDNELLTRTGPGTPMGNLMRRYWIPALLSCEVQSPDGDPVRVRLLGENFIAWRDQKGQVALFDEACPHRCASLALARCEGDGLRCLYHGWKFAVDGTLIEAPNLPQPAAKGKVRANVYPTQELGGIIWVYLGPPETQPSPPAYPFMTAAPGHADVTRTVLRANWLQSLEGHLDSSHVGILHKDWDPLGADTDEDYIQHVREDHEGLVIDEQGPRIEVDETAFGFHMGALRVARHGGESVTYARVHAFSLPWMCIVPPRTYTFEVPIDDESVSVIFAVFDSDKPIDSAAMSAIYGDDTMYTWDKAGAVRTFEGSESNRWFQNRDAMRQKGSFSGIPGFLAEDSSIVVSMGAIVDRSKEHLAASDVGVVRARRVLLRAVRGLQNGTEPPMMSPEAQFRMQAGDGVVPVDGTWRDLVPGNLDEQVTR